MSDAQDTELLSAVGAGEDDDEAGFEDDGFATEGYAPVPPRPRRVLVNRYTVLLSAVVLGGACFYAGVRVEKSDVGTSSGTGGGLAALASRFGGSGAAGASSSGGASGFAARFGGGAGGAGGAGGFGAGAGGFGAGTRGTISTIDGDTLYVTETGGNTVKVNLTATTTLSKTETVSKSKLYPGDTVSVTGSTGANGTVSATSVTDSGSAGSAATGSAATGSSGSGAAGASGSSSGASGLSSLFGG